MIKNSAQAIIEDGLGKNPVTLDVNFDKEQPDCVRITLGDKFSIVKYSDLFAFMFQLATKEQQAQMIPVREELGNQYMKQVTIKATKDIKEGELVKFHIPINVPQVIEDAILKEKLSPYLTEEGKK